MSSPITVTTEVDIYLDEIDTEDLRDELESRGEPVGFTEEDARELLEQIWLKRRMNQDYQRELGDLIYCILGKAI